MYTHTPLLVRETIQVTLRGSPLKEQQLQHEAGEIEPQLCALLHGQGREQHKPAGTPSNP